jgi:ABC-type sugar transport system substrate-binding protein
MLQANPNINILWSENEGGTVGEVLAVGSMNLQNKVFRFWYRYHVQLADFLLADDNVLQAVTGQSPRLMGSQSSKPLYQCLKGRRSIITMLCERVLFTR